MMIKIASKLMIIVSLIMFYILCAGKSFSYIVDNQKDFITIKGIRVDGMATSDLETTKENALANAKEMAFEAVKESMKYDDIQIDPVNIDACISSFLILDEYYNENFYSILANFTFSKDLLASIVRRTIENRKGGGEVVNLVVTLKEKDDIIEEYVRFRKFLNKEKIVFHLMRITATEIEIKIHKVIESKIYLQLKQLGLNGSIYLD